MGSHEPIARMHLLFQTKKQSKDLPPECHALHCINMNSTNIQHIPCLENKALIVVNNSEPSQDCNSNQSHFDKPLSNKVGPMCVNHQLTIVNMVTLSMMI